MLYQRLKAPASTNERIEFITELADALKSEPHSTLSNEVFFLDFGYTGQRQQSTEKSNAYFFLV